jgi:hypothetical protein
LRIGCQLPGALITAKSLLEPHLNHQVFASPSPSSSNISHNSIRPTCQARACCCSIAANDVSAPSWPSNPGRHVVCEHHSSSSSHELNIVIAEPAPELKLVISIQHRPSAQHAQFSAKPRTRVGKILAGACKSFRLDVNVSVLNVPFASCIPCSFFLRL